MKFNIFFKKEDKKGDEKENEKMIYALKRGDSVAMLKHIKNGADPNCFYKEKKKPLDIAIRKNDLKNTLGFITPPTAPVEVGAVPLTLTIPTATGTAVITLPSGGKSDTSDKTLLGSSVEAVKNAEQKTAVIHQSAVEIKKSIDNGDLQDAVNKLRDLNETVVTTQQQLVQTKNNATVEANAQAKVDAAAKSTTAN